MNAPVVAQWLNTIWSYVYFVALAVFLAAAVRYWRGGYRLEHIRMQLVLWLALMAFGDACVRAIVLYAYYARGHGGGDGTWIFLSRFVQVTGVLCVVGALGAIRAATWDRWKERLWITVLGSGILVAIAVHYLAGI